MGRTLILGIDGAEPSLIFRWAREGHLPTFQKLLAQSAWGKLRSTLHPLTPQAWTSMITGVNPGRHGIFDFGKRRAGGYQVDLVTSGDRASPAFWQFVPDGAKVGVANVPLTWPPEPLPGFMVTGMHTPDIRNGVWPPEILAELGDGYQVDVMAHWYDEPERFLADLFAMHDARHQAFLRLFDHHMPDIGFFVYVAADRVQHAFWGEMTQAHIEKPGEHNDLGDAVFVVHQTLDRVLADWLERLGPDDHLLVVSDHGFGDLRRDVYLNRILIEAGLLRFDPAKIKAFVPPPEPDTSDKRHTWMKNVLPQSEELPEDDEALADGLCDVRRLTFETVDWSRTLAYSRGLCGNVWLNLAGREPAGIVRPEQVKEVRRKVRAALSAVKDPDDGQPVVDRIIDKEEVYHGPSLAMAPDLLVIMRDYAYTTRGATEFWGKTAVGPVVVGHSGNHRMDGVWIANGPKVEPGEIVQANLLDVLPTAFHLMNWPVPSDLDGQVLLDVLKPDYRSIHQGTPLPPAEKALSEPAEAEREIIRKRLRDLGYLG